MNWDYVRGKKNQKENKNKQTKRKQTKKKIKKNFIRQFGSVFNKKMVKSVIYSAAPQGI
jgi:Rod binding domain-containing protein